MSSFVGPRGRAVRALLFSIRRCRLLPALLVLAAPDAFAQVSLVALDAPYTQDFDALPASGAATANPWLDNSTLPGWYNVRASGTTTGIAADTGSGTGGSLYSYGASGNVDRALGTLNSNATGDFYTGVLLQNDTGATITSLDVAYTGEQWRNGGNTTAQKIAFSYVVGAPGVDAGSFAAFSAATAIPVAALDFTSPVATASAGALDGNAAANRTALASTITGLAIAPGAQVMLRWFDHNESGNDHGLALDGFSVVAHGAGGGGPVLSINDVSHDEGDAGTTTFSFTVSLSSAAAGDVTVDVATADGTATAPSDYAGMPATTLTIPAGFTSTTFDVSVDGDTASEPDETFFVNLSNANGATLADAQGVGTIVNDDIAITKIHDVQGNGAASPMQGANVTVEGVATGVFLGANRLNGFFLQEEDADADADPSTSEGIFVFCTGCTGIAEGQRVRAGGTVSEFQGLTEISATAGSVAVTDVGNHGAEVTPSPVTLPVSGDLDAFYEARESMLVTYTDTLTVAEYFELFRFGHIELVAGERSRTFTEDHAPDVAGNAAHLDALTRRSVILDDDNNLQEAPLAQPDGSQAAYWPRTNGGFSVGTQGIDYFRGGDQVANLTGVLHWSWPGSGANTWRIRPTSAHPVTFTVANPRPATPPAVGGAIRAVGMNLLNYFTTIDTTASNGSGPCGPDHTQDCRGADSVAELARQRERASIVVCTLAPDVAGFMELENTTRSDTITDLLGAINARCGGAHPYAFVDTGGTLGTDAIRVAQVYRTGVVSPVGAPLVDLDPVHNRPPTAQTYDVVDAANPAFGQRFTVVANHFKSKGSCPTSGPDADQLDGQACWAATRTQQATRLMQWIDGTVVPAAGDPDVLLLGDFNSYAHETPVSTLEGGGYSDLETLLHGAQAYSYLFNGELGHLDYAFASASLTTQVTGADAWHINADEADLFDYNDEIRDTGEAVFEEKPDGSALVPPRVVFQAASPYRASDHDPVVVGLFAVADLGAGIVDAPDPVVAGGTLDYTITIDNAGPASAAGASWSDTLPTGTTFVALAAPVGWTCTTPAVGAAGTASCSAPTLAVGSGVFTLSVAVDASLAGGSVLTNTVTVDSVSSDGNPANDSATATTSVNAAPAGMLTITPTAIDFGDQRVGTTGPAHAVTLGNAGNAALDVTALGAAQAPFARTGGTCAATLPITLAVGASCTLEYAFSPNATGAAAQTITIGANAPGSGSVAFSGNGVQGHLAITPAAIDFGSQTVGTTSAERPVTLANDGTASLAVTALTDAASPFARSGGTCGALPLTLAAGADCTLGFTFSPSASGAAQQVLAVGADAPGDGSIALAGTGVAPQADVALVLDDGRDYVQVGDTLDYVITVSNAGPATATASVIDALPTGLADGSWVCVPAGAAACTPAGTGDTLADSATLPAGTSASYVYSATVQAGAPETLLNSASATVGGGAVDSNPANNAASDMPDVLVIFRNGFDTATAVLPLAGAADAAGSSATTLRIHPALLASLGIMPVEVARVDTHAGPMLAIEMARFGPATVMRLVARDAHAGIERGAWQAFDARDGLLEFAWRPATADEEGYVAVAGTGGTVVLDGLDGARVPARLRVTFTRGEAWLSREPE